MTLIEKIKSRGYWEILIHPTAFVEKRVPNILELRQIVRSKRGQLRGWEFPYYGREEPRIGTDYIAQEVDFLTHVESWRLHQSGQFIYLGGIRVDWAVQDPSHHRALPRQEPGSLLAIGDTVWILTEAFEFAAGLALSDAGGERMRVSATVTGLRGRTLWMDLPGRFPALHQPIAGLDVLPQSAEFSREELVAESGAHALHWAREVFRRFDWDASLDILKEIQDRFS